MLILEKRIMDRSSSFGAPSPSLEGSFRGVEPSPPVFSEHGRGARGGGSYAGSAVSGASDFYSDSVQQGALGAPSTAERANSAEFASYRGLSEAMGGLFNSPMLSDVIIEVVEDPRSSSVPQRMPAHRVVLAGWSDKWMKAMHDDTQFGARQPVLRIERYPPDVIFQLIEFCYKAKTTVTLDTAIPLLAASRDYQIEELRRFCEDFCLQSMQTTGVCSLHEMAKQYNCRRLAKATLGFITENGEESLGSRDSTNLSKESLLLVLQTDDLVCQETTVFDCCARWVRAAAAKELGDTSHLDQQGKAEAQAARLQKEREMFRDYSDLIRYPKIDPDTLRDTVVPSGLVNNDYLMEALLYHAAPRQAVDSPMVNHRFRQRKAPAIGQLQWSAVLSSKRMAIHDLDTLGVMEDTDEWR